MTMTDAPLSCEHLLATFAEDPTNEAQALDILVRNGIRPSTVDLPAAMAKAAELRAQWGDYFGALREDSDRNVNRMNKGTSRA